MGVQAIGISPMGVFLQSFFSVLLVCATITESCILKYDQILGSGL